MRHRLILVALLATACESGAGGTTAGDGGPTGEGGGAAGGAGGQGGGAAGSGGAGGEVVRRTVRFELAVDPPTTPFGDIPFPNDLYRDAEGALDLRGFTTRSGILVTLIDAIEEETDGFGTSATLYVSFDGPVSTAALPADGAASLEPDAALFLVDVDPASRERGRRWPIYWRTLAEGSAYLPPSSLMVRLVEGVALRPRTTYALVVTGAVGLPSPGFEKVMATDRPADAHGRAWDVYTPLRDWAADQSPPVDVAGGAVFTTQDPVSELFAARDFIYTLPPPELLGAEGRGVQQGRFEVIDGTYRAPRFQEGEIPYLVKGQGAIRFDDDGNPIVQGYEDIRFSMSVPVEEAPPRGWPLVMYAHGTGGSFHSYIGGTVASVLARQGVAVISIDQIYHGTRDNGRCSSNPAPDSCVSLLFFNFLVPTTGRDNNRQAALDFVNLLRFARDVQIPTEATLNHRDIPIDVDNVMFMGHSQGGLNGPLFLAIEPDVKGGVLSAAGASIGISIELKKKPVDINQTARVALGIRGEDVLDRWHPAMALLQTFVEPADPVNYARFWFAEPPAGFKPKSVFMTIGLLDDYTPPETNFALVAAGRVPIIEPVEAPIPGLDLLGIPSEFPPFQGNVANGKASAGLAQYAAGDHFVVFKIASARQRYSRFLLSLATQSPPQVF